MNKTRNGIPLALLALSFGWLSGCQKTAAPTVDSQIHQELEARSDRTVRATGLLQSGLEKYRASDYDAAARELKQAVTLAPQNVQAWIALGMTYYACNNFFEAAQAFNKAIGIAPDRFEPHYDLAVVLETAGLYKAAIQQYQRALELAPDDLATQENFARCLVTSGTGLEQAKKLIDRSLEVELRSEWRQWLERQSRVLDARGITTQPVPVSQPLNGGIKHED